METDQTQPTSIARRERLGGLPKPVSIKRLHRVILVMYNSINILGLTFIRFNRAAAISISHVHYRSGATPFQISQLD